MVIHGPWTMDHGYAFLGLGTDTPLGMTVLGVRTRVPPDPHSRGGLRPPTPPLNVGLRPPHLLDI